MIRWPDGLDPTRFLETHWQKQWLMLPSALPGVPGLLSPEILAGLACEVEVESRLVLRHADSWEVRHGPFDEAEFAGLPERDWTLLVQNVETHLPELRSVLASFSFVPLWRLDDLMVSCSAPGGTVGAHVDAYDVFLLQGAGTRTWQLDPAPADLSLRLDLDIGVLQRFQAAQTVTTHPGDVLYLPPGVAHYGVGAVPSMTWSIGFRAPSAADLLYAAAEQLDEGDACRYSDPDLRACEVAGSRIDRQSADRARDVLTAAMPLDEAQLLDLLGRAATRLKPWQRPEPPVERPDDATVNARLRDGLGLLRHPAARLAWAEMPDAVLLFADGAAYRMAPAAADFAAYIAGTDALAADVLKEHALSTPVAGLIAALIAQGTLDWDEPGPPDRPGDGLTE